MTLLCFLSLGNAAKTCRGRAAEAKGQLSLCSTHTVCEVFWGSIRMQSLHCSHLTVPEDSHNMQLCMLHMLLLCYFVW